MTQYNSARSLTEIPNIGNISLHSLHLNISVTLIRKQKLMDFSYECRDCCKSIRNFVLESLIVALQAALCMPADIWASHSLNLSFTFLL